MGSMVVGIALSIASYNSLQLAIRDWKTDF